MVTRRPEGMKVNEKDGKREKEQRQTLADPRLWNFLFLFGTTEG